MSKPDQLHEPSMEEILASIRRAIDEDSRFATGKEQMSSDQVVRLADDVLGMTRAARGPARRTSQAKQEKPDEGRASVLRPSFGIGSNDDVAAGKPAEGSSSQAADPSLKESAKDEAEVASGQASSRNGGPEMALEQIKPQTDAATAGSSAAEDAADSPLPAAADLPLRRSDLDAVVSSAFEKLVEQISEARRRSTPTLEDLARDLMRPVIKEWLDQNLAGIVERMVQEEIERVTRRHLS